MKSCRRHAWLLKQLLETYILNYQLLSYLQNVSDHFHMVHGYREL